MGAFHGIPESWTSKDFEPKPKFLKLYLVFENDYEGSFLHDIFLSEDKAKAYKDETNERLYKGSSLPHLSIEEWEVQE